MSLRCSEPGYQHGVAGLQAELLGHEGSRRGIHAGDHDVEFARQRGDDVPGQPQHRGALAQIPEQEPELDDRAHLVQAELKLRHDAEVTSTTSDRPE